jgi:ABC-type branched-subunit amino acid transport system ATPase component
MTPGIPRPSQSCRGSTNYGKVDALQGVDLEIQPGELVALLGPNGAGKTTAVSILLGQRRPDAGSARLLGRDPTLPAARRPVGVTLQESEFPDNLTVAEVVDWSESTTPTPHQRGTCSTGSAWPPVGLARGLVGRQTSDELHDARDQGENGHSD